MADLADVHWSDKQKATLPKTFKAVEDNRKDMGVCGFCRFAYRSTQRGEEGKVICGQPESSYAGSIIDDPFGTGCTKWKFRHKGQPSIGDEHTEEGRKFNKRLARYVRIMEAKAKIEEVAHRKRMETNTDPFGWATPTKNINVQRK